MPLSPGTTLGSYQVTAKIGEGGMGEVYRARDTKLDRDVALKVLPQAFTEDPDRLARFEREAKVLASLNHPGIAGIYGLEESGDTRALVLELVEGPTLADRIAKGPIPLDEALPIAKQIAEALEAAHEAGVIHRDLKPANIKVRDDGTVKVLDFGLAKALDPTPEGDPSQSPTLTAAATQMGVIMGTAAYMSPEQARGKPVDKRADIWAFGCVFYEMLTGTKPFPGDDVSQTLARVIDRDVDWTILPTTLAPGLSTFLRQCLEKDPLERIRDIGDVRLALNGVFEPMGNSRSESVAQPTLAVWQRPATTGVAVLMSLAVGGLGVWAVLQPEPQRVTRFAISTSPPAVISGGGTPDVVISPDGTRIVYLAGPAALLGGPLFVRAVDQLDAAPLRGTETQALNPFMSPDGNWVGYWNTQEGALNKVSIHGGPPLTIAESSGIDGASWGEDDTIIFAMRARPTGLFRVSAGGGDAEVLTTLEEGEVAHRWPHILPGGRAVLFTVIGDPTRAIMEIVALRLDTGERTVLISGGSNPIYVPTGHLVYGVNGTLLAVGFDVEGLALEGDPFPVLEGVVTPDTGAANFSVASDGSLVYLSGGASAARERTLVWVDRQGQETALDLRDARSYDTPRLSPDGTRLAVTVGELGAGNQDVWVSDLASGTLRRLTTAPGRDFDPLWSPDGQRILFASDREGTFGLYATAWDGAGDEERLITIADLQALRPYGWTPDGGVLFELFGVAASYDIGLLPMNGDGTWEPVLDTEANERAPALSPDGQWLAYVSDETGVREVYVERFPDLGGEQLISRGGGDYPVWSRDGRELFYVNADRGLTVVSVELGSTLRVGVPVTLFSTSPYEEGLGFSRAWDVSPDGQQLLMRKPAGQTTTEGQNRTQLVLVQNWHEELERLVPVN